MASSPVRPKKHLGQHFLKDESIAANIVSSLSQKGYAKVLEIGPGTGVLTKYLLEDSEIDFTAVEVDPESFAYLQHKFPSLDVVHEDFLKGSIDRFFQGDVAIIGNFPYNISSQILFKVLEHKDSVKEVVGMFQKEVAQRIASPPGSKVYGILSVFLQAFYDIEYLFTVPPTVFIPPPKVESAVIRLKRNQLKELPVDEKLFFRVVKAAFNQRRKTIRNSLKGLFGELPSSPLLSKRPEQLSVEEFTELTRLVNFSD